MPHIHDNIDFTVEVFVVKDGKVLLRKHDKYNKWLSIGGHVELNEDTDEAVVREVKEEVGLNINLVSNGKLFDLEKDQYKHLIIPFFMNRHRINNNHEHITLIYFAKSESYEIVQGEKEVSQECRWFTMKELDSSEYDLKDHIKFYAKRALIELSN